MSDVVMALLGRGDIIVVRALGDPESGQPIGEFG